MVRYKTTLLSKHQLTSDVMELIFEKPPGFDYRAGQFVQWVVPLGEETVLRPYSCSSAPGDSTVDFCLKILPGGSGSALAEALRPGDTLAFEGPRGKFVRDGNGMSLYFIATGVGIAPLMSMIRDELEYKKSGAEIRLMFGVRREEDIFWQDRLDNLRKQFSNFSYHLTLSQPQTADWNGLRGRVTDHLRHHTTDHEFFLCGNAAMVKDVRASLLDSQIPMNRIRVEIF